MSRKKILMSFVFLCNAFFSSASCAELLNQKKNKFDNQITNQSLHGYFVELGAGVAFNTSENRSTEDGALPRTETHHSPTTATSLAIGYKYSRDLRFAWNFAYLSPSTSSVNGQSAGLERSYNARISSAYSMINGYYDIRSIALGDIFPYFVAGIGVSNNSVGDVEEFIGGELSSKFYANNELSLAWKLGAGINYEINDNLLLNLGYNFVNLGSVSTKIPNSVVHTASSIDTMVLAQDKIKFTKLYSHQFLLGLSVFF